MKAAPPKDALPVKMAEPPKHPPPAHLLQAKEEQDAKVKAELSGDVQLELDELSKQLQHTLERARELKKIQR